MLSTILFATLMISSVACGVGVVILAEREKRFPSFFYLIELTGRWWSIPADRANPLVASAVMGSAGFFVSFALLLI